MKRIVFLLALLLVSFAGLHAQGNGGGNGNGNSQQAWNGGGNPWANGNAPQWFQNWLQNGGEVPMPLAVIVIREARAWGQQNFGMNQGQMIAKYLQGLLTVEFVSTAPPSLTFRVRFGGGDVIIVLDDLL